MLDELQIQTNRALRVGDTGIADLHGKVRVLGRRFVGDSSSSGEWSIMTTAIAQRQVLVADYENRMGEKSHVDIAPLAVWFADGRAYLLAAGAIDQKLMVWRIANFSNILVDSTKQAPAISEEVIEGILRKSFKGYISDPAVVCLKVKPDSAYLFREFQYHPTQDIVELPDGSLEVTIECAIGWGLEEWILGLSGWVVVQGPEVLKTRIKDRLASGLNEYC